MDRYPIFEIPANAQEALEQVGSKQKFWYDDSRWIFKGNRGIGDDWAEKVSAEVAGKLGLPHAAYDLAAWNSHDVGVNGVRSSNFCPRDAILVLGNELLTQVGPDYSEGITRYRQVKHTIGRVAKALQLCQPAIPLGWTSPEGVDKAFDVLIGYLLLDALVGNTDRHHQNWGLIQTSDGIRRLAPTYDHASSLGCHLRDDERLRRMETKDRNYNLTAYAARAASALFLNEDDRKPLSTLDAFLEAARLSPVVARYWIQNLEQIAVEDFAILVSAVPPERITPISAEFATRLLIANKARLCEAKTTIK